MSSENSHFKVIPRPFNTSLCIPSSKSHSNRSLILAALTPGSTSLSPLSLSSDTRNLVRCLEKMGLKTERRGRRLTLHNSFPACEPSAPVTLETGDGGTTIRFLTALAARGRQTYHFRPAGSMKKRPLEGLLNILEQLGVHILLRDGNTFALTGPCRPPAQPVSIDCSLTTQFASALMLALVDTGIPVLPVNIASSRPYLALTEQLIRQFPLQHHDIPPDFSALGYPLALAISGGRVTVENCHRLDLFQADSILISIAREMGAQVDWTERGLFACGDGRPLAPLERNVSDHPDLAPTLAFLASCASGVSRLGGLDVLRHKESHRIQEILRLLKTFCVPHTFDDQKSELTMAGPAPTANFLSYDPPDDHRMVMTAYLFMRKHSGGRLSNTHHVAKSFPHFFEVMDGGK